MIERGKQYLFHTLGWAVIGTVVDLDPGTITVDHVVTAGWVDELEEQLHSGAMRAVNEWVVAPAEMRRSIPRGSVLYADDYPHTLPTREDAAKGGLWKPKGAKAGAR